MAASENWVIIFKNYRVCFNMLFKDLGETVTVMSQKLVQVDQIFSERLHFDFSSVFIGKILRSSGFQLCLN